MHADNGDIDHLDSGIMGTGKWVNDAAPTPARRQRAKRL